MAYTQGGGYGPQKPYQQGGGYGPQPQGWGGNISSLHANLPQVMQQFQQPQFQQGGGAPVMGPRAFPGATYQDFPRATAPFQQGGGKRVDPNLGNKPMPGAKATPMQGALQAIMGQGPKGASGPFQLAGTNFPAGKGAGAFQGVLRDMIMRLFSQSAGQFEQGFGR